MASRMRARLAPSLSDQAARVQVGSIQVPLNEMGGERSSNSGLHSDQGFEGRNPRQCTPRSTQLHSMQIKSDKLRDRIQYMNDHTQIGTFVVIFPFEKALIWWIKSTWKPRGNFNLHLGSKGLFIVSFINLEYRN